jgi:hypothetical protein
MEKDCVCRHFINPRFSGVIEALTRPYRFSGFRASQKPLKQGLMKSR